jgi:activating signal cointegrator 1
VKALTVYQPWATLETLGLKGTETRGRPTKHRGPLVIHAGKQWSVREQRAAVNIDAYLRRSLGGVGLPDELPRGCVIGVGNLLDCFQVTEENQCHFAEFDRVAGDLSLGRWVWVLEHVKALREPIPWPGAQGLWTCPTELVMEILKQTHKRSTTDATTTYTR